MMKREMRGRLGPEEEDKRDEDEQRDEHTQAEAELGAQTRREGWHDE
jgi:hypothetical protein